MTRALPAILAIVLPIATAAAPAPPVAPTKRAVVKMRWGGDADMSPDPIGTAAMAVAKRYQFAGQYILSRGDSSWNVDTIERTAPVGRRQTARDFKAMAAPRVWRWASVTKQVVATLVMQEVAAGRIKLDVPVATYLPRFASANAKLVTVRQLLRHQSGLPNPDDTAPAPGAMPAYDAPAYAGSRDPETGYCAGPVKGSPGGAWSYNNCDYVVAGAVLRAVTGKSWQALVRERITRPLKLASVGTFPRKEGTEPGFIGGQPEPAYNFAAFDAAAGLYGTALDLWRFDRALLAGKLLPEKARAEMWDGQPQLGAIALGQWVFTAPLKGCAAPVRIVERRGQIGGVEVRNVILPDRDVVVIAFVNRADFDFGEVWQGRGFTYDMLSAAACT